MTKTFKKVSGAIKKNFLINHTRNRERYLASRIVVTET